MNDNGELIANMYFSNSLIIGGSIISHKRIHKVNYISPDGRTENQFDHFCISLKYSSLQDVKIIRGAEIGSDHHLQLAKVRLRLKKCTASTSKRTFPLLKDNTPFLIPILPLLKCAILYLRVFSCCVVLDDLQVAY